VEGGKGKGKGKGTSAKERIDTEKQTWEVVSNKNIVVGVIVNKTKTRDKKIKKYNSRTEGDKKKASWVTKIR